MTEIDLDALEATARAATPGPWEIGPVSEWGDDDDISQAAVLVSGSPLTWDDHGGDVFKPEDARHIAAFDPPTVLALIARLREAEKERDDALRRMLALDQANDEEIDRTDLVEARLREAEACIAEVRANAVELLDADDDSYDGSLSATWAVELIDRYKTTKTERNEP